MNEDDDKRIGDALDALDVHPGDVNKVFEAIDGAGYEVVAKGATPADAATKNPLEALGLGSMWRPTPTSWKWATVDYGERLRVLRMFNGGGAFGGALTTEQLRQFVLDAQVQLAKALEPAESLAVRRPSLLVPGGRLNRGDGGDRPRA